MFARLERGSLPHRWLPTAPEVGHNFYAHGTPGAVAIFGVETGKDERTTRSIEALPVTTEVLLLIAQPN